jgi:hypothetical protein
MAIPTTSITGLLNTGKTPQEKFEVLKQNGYLTQYALENPQKFLDFLLIAEEDVFRERSRIREGENYGYDPNSVSRRLIGEGFIINYGICHLCGVKHEVGRLCSEFSEEKNLLLRSPAVGAAENLCSVLCIAGAAAGALQIKCRKSQRRHNELKQELNTAAIFKGTWKQHEDETTTGTSRLTHGMVKIT